MADKNEAYIRILGDRIEFGGFCKAKDFHKQIEKIKKMLGDEK